MPCNSDHMDPQGSEIEMSQVYMLLDEIEGRTPKGARPKQSDWHGYDARVYGQRLSKEACDAATARLCTAIQAVDDVTGYSLELQLWWRDHQEIDRLRLQAQMRNARTEEAKRGALAKLTLYERKLLGL